jgi:hypothetical protein
MGSTLFSGARSSLLLLLDVDPEWHGIFDEALHGACEALIFYKAMTNDQPAYFWTPAMQIAEMVLSISRRRSLASVSACESEWDEFLACDRVARIDSRQCAGVCMLF